MMNKSEPEDWKWWNMERWEDTEKWNSALYLAFYANPSIRGISKELHQGEENIVVEDLNFLVQVHLLEILDSMC